MMATHLIRMHEILLNIQSDYERTAKTVKECYD